MTDRQQGRTGLWGRTIKRIAQRHGHKLKTQRAIDWEQDYGLLRLPDHAVILRNGLVIDTDATIWEADAFLANRQIDPSECELMVCVEP